ncbi:MAG TPA: Gfo/Idh/MocA family oxidoreductase, partial [Myxococcota bacterium]|nr:Gfo/Idh/MocA family oxidoreductase [Myxococcota bacterium]
MSSTASCRGAVVGFGKIAESTHLGALEATDLRVVAVVETEPSRCQAALQLLPGVRVYGSMAALLGHERLDFVDICTPPHLHFDAICQALRAGVHVLCEKPLVLTLQQGTEVARLAAVHEKVVTCVHNWTQAPILRRAAEHARSGALGALERVDLITLRTQPAAAVGDKGNWRVDPSKAGGGILFDHGWHGMSILLRSVGAPPRVIRGRTEKRRYVDLSVEDTSETWVEFANGVVGRFAATWAASERRNEARLVCADGIIEVENNTLRLRRGDSLLETETFTESLAGGGYR